MTCFPIARVKQMEQRRCREELKYREDRLQNNTKTTTIKLKTETKFIKIFCFQMEILEFRVEKMNIFINQEQLFTNSELARTAICNKRK